MSGVVSDRKEKWKWTIRKGRKIRPKRSISFDAGNVQGILFLAVLQKSHASQHTVNSEDVLHFQCRGLYSTKCFV